MTQFTQSKCSNKILKQLKLSESEQIEEKYTITSANTVPNTTQELSLCSLKPAHRHPDMDYRPLYVNIYKLYNNTHPNYHRSDFCCTGVKVFFPQLGIDSINVTEAGNHRR